MTLPPVRLDDLTFDDMVAAIRRRIPAESDGHWTLHAPVDPGITLLELFAALLEQRLYWLDQVPDTLVRAVLRLLGQDGLRPARAAATVLAARLDPDAVPPAGVPRVATGTVLTRDPAEAVVCVVEHPITVLPVLGLAVHAGGRDRTADLRAGAGVGLLPSDGGAGEARIELSMPAPTRPWPGERISLLLELDAPADRVPPQWSPDAVADVPPPARVTWGFDGPGGPAPFLDVDVEDGTGGLRRSGVVRLRYPDAWRGFPVATERAHTLVLRTDAATFAAPPVLRGLEVNVAVARNRGEVRPTSTERGTLARRIGGWLPLPGRHLELPGAAGGLLAAHLVLRERDGARYTWTATDDLAFHGRTDRVFVLDRDAGALRFGDGRTGRVPVPDPADPIVELWWETGGGADANGGTTGNWRARHYPWLLAANPVPLAGGRDPETVAQARVRAAAALDLVHRAVTVADHVEIARSTPGVAVARAHARIGGHPDHPCDAVPGAVTVRVVPWAPRADDALGTGVPGGPDRVPAPRPDPGLLVAVRRRLDDARLAGAELFLAGPRYRTVWLRVDTAGTPPADAATVRARIRSALERFLDPLTGGDDGDGHPFGEPLRPSALARVAQSACGPDADVVAVAVRVDSDPADPVWEDCGDTPIRSDELVHLVDVRVRFLAGAVPGPAAGGLS